MDRLKHLWVGGLISEYLSTNKTKTFLHSITVGRTNASNTQKKLSINILNSILLMFTSFLHFMPQTAKNY